MSNERRKKNINLHPLPLNSKKNQPPPPPIPLQHIYIYIYIYIYNPLTPPPWPLNNEKIVLRKKKTPFPSSFHMSNEGGKKKTLTCTPSPLQE
jgi:hypothetical protein